MSHDNWQSPNAPCENYYWMDFSTNGGLDIVALQNFKYAISVYLDTLYPIINNSDNPCYEKHLGEECCIPN